MRSLVILAFASLAACAAAPVPPPAAGSVRTIRYETQPCFGMCPVYVLTVSSDGRGTFDGKDHTAAKGEHGFQVTPQQFAEFERRLAPYRPAGERRIAEPDCGGMIATDLPSVDITWTGKGASSHLYAYYGCDMRRNKAMFDALKAAPEAFPPAQALIGGR